LIALALGVFLCGRIGLSYWVDLLWFQSLGYGEVFWKSIGLQIVDFVVFAGTTFLILYGAFSAIRRSHEADLPRAHSIVIAGEPISLSVQPVLRVISFCVSIVIACATGLSLMADWPTLALFWYAPHAAGSVADPIFGKPLNFFSSPCLRGGSSITGFSRWQLRSVPSLYCSSSLQVVHVPLPSGRLPMPRHRGVDFRLQ